MKREREGRREKKREQYTYRDKEREQDWVKGTTHPQTARVRVCARTHTGTHAQHTHSHT